MAAVAARAGAARVGFRRMFSVSAFAPPPPPTARPAAEPCNNLFVSGNSSSRASSLPLYFSAVKSTVLLLLLCPGFEARAKVSYLWYDAWEAIITCWVKSRLSLYFCYSAVWMYPQLSLLLMFRFRDFG